MDPVLLRGELGIEIDTGKLKVGNGNAKWSELSYLFAGFTKGEVLDMVYPKDLVCITLSDSSPDEVFGGTWEKLEAEGMQLGSRPCYFWTKNYRRLHGGNYHQYRV